MSTLVLLIIVDTLGHHAHDELISKSSHNDTECNCKDETNEIENSNIKIVEEIQNNSDN